MESLFVVIAGVAACYLVYRLVTRVRAPKSGNGGGKSTGRTK